MRQLLIGALLLTLSACASAPALACELLWADAVQQLEHYNARVTQLSERAREVVGQAYNEQPPVSDYTFSAIYFVEVMGRSGIALVVDGCVVDQVTMTRLQLESIYPGV